MSAGLPWGAPVSTHRAIVAISAAVRLGSFEKSPMDRSANHGGI
jgi:hypothetical protein